jgi:hypothetical protein
MIDRLTKMEMHIHWLAWLCMERIIFRSCGIGYSGIVSDKFTVTVGINYENIYTKGEFFWPVLQFDIFSAGGLGFNRGFGF